MIALSALLLLLGACDESKTGPAKADPAQPAMPAQGTALAKPATPPAAAPTTAAAAAPTAAAAATPTAAGGEPAPIAVGTKMKCPVSGEDFTVKPTTQQLTYNGKRYAFCCPDCPAQFKANPTKYVTQ